MKLLTKGWLTVATLLAGGLLAMPAPVGAEDKPAVDLPGLMNIVDEAGLFSTDAKTQAEKKMGAAKFNRGLHFNVETQKEMPAEWKKKYDDATDKAKVVKDWAKSIAKGDKAKGPFVLICMKPGWTVVLADEESVNRGFGKTSTEAVQKIFDTALREAAKQEGETRTKTRDAALLKATDYVINDLKGTKVVPK
jgi:uncharacterized protein